MKKRKNLISLIVLTLVSFVMLLSACSFTFALDGCNGLNGCIPESKPNPAPVIDETGQTEFVFAIEERDSFFYPTFKGTVCFTYHPDKITLDCVDREMTLSPTSLRINPDGTYVFTFHEDIIYGHLEPGEYTARIIGYKGNVSTVSEEYTTFSVDDSYFALNAVYDIDWDDPNAEITYICAMDKERNWTPSI